MNVVAMKSSQIRKRAAAGFTLVEIMVVVLIIAIMAALIIPNVINKMAEAKRAAAASDLSTLDSALQQFKLNCDRFPTTDEGLQALLAAPSDLQSKWKGPYIPKLPNDPWGHAYIYQYPGQSGPDTYDLYSNGPTGQAGGTGADAPVYPGTNGSG